MSEEMNVEIDVFEHLKEQFYEDPLYREIEADLKLRDELFPESLNTLNLSKNYTTKEASELINTNDSNIRYYMNNLMDYIQPIKNNRNYRLTYESIYKLYLVFLFTRDYGRNLNDVKALLPEYGIHPISVGKNPASREVSKSQKNPYKFNDGQLLGFLLNMAHFSNEKDESEYTIHVKYIEKIQKEKELSDIKENDLKPKELKQMEYEKELVALQSDLERIKSTLRLEAQGQNMQSYFQLNKKLLLDSLKQQQPQQQTFTDKLKGLFTSKKTDSSSEIEVPDVDLVIVEEDHPKIVAQQELIKKKKEDLENIKLEVENILTKIADKKKELDLFNESLIDLMEQSPRFKDYEVYNQLYDVYSKVKNTEKEINKTLDLEDM